MNRSVTSPGDDTCSLPAQVTIDEGGTPFGPIFLAAGGRGLCRVTIPGEPFEALLSWLEKKLPAAAVEQAPGSLAAESAALGEFLDSGAELPPMAIELIGTPFQIDVWQAVLAIPYGETRSYAEIARDIGNPRASRAVGAANAVNPLPFIIPCHRVIGADGTIKGFPGGLITRPSARPGAPPAIGVSTEMPITA